MSNAEIANRLLSVAQLLSLKKENPFKVKAYRRAAATIKAVGESLEELVRDQADLTAYSGIGKAIAAVIYEIVSTGTSGLLETLRTEVKPEVAAINEYPRLDPARVLRIYRKLKISSIEALKERLENGEIALKLGARMDQHVRQALTATHEMLLYEADRLVEAVEGFMLSKCGVTRIEVAGDYRRRVEVVSDISFLIETADFASTVEAVATFGGGAGMVRSDASEALFQLPCGIFLRIEKAEATRWGLALLIATGSESHLQKLKLRPLTKSKALCRDEIAVYNRLGLSYIEPELREGRDEVELAALGTLPELVGQADIRGELHAHSTSSDGMHSIEQMAHAAAAKGYQYTGITDHSKSLKIAGGVSEEDLWKQIRFIDKLNAKRSAFRILKSAEVDILADGSLDYSDELLRELDYTVCSIHSKFVLGKEEQTERIMRAMDNRYFTILGHATGRLLLKRPGYEIDVDRVVEHARKTNCFIEINSSPDRLDFSAVNARIAGAAGVKIAITTDAHAMREYDLIRCGIEQARRAGLSKDMVLNTRPWEELKTLLKR